MKAKKSSLLKGLPRATVSSVNDLQESDSPGAQPAIAQDLSKQSARKAQARNKHLVPALRPVHSPAEAAREEEEERSFDDDDEVRHAKLQDWDEDLDALRINTQSHPKAEP